MSIAQFVSVLSGIKNGTVDLIKLVDFHSVRG